MAVLFNSLNKRLILIFAVTLVLFTMATLYFNAKTTEMSLQEVVQRLNKDFAAALVRQWYKTEGPTLKKGRIKELFAETLETNSSISVYLLDPRGQIVCTSVDAGAIETPRVNVRPLEMFVDMSQPLPILGENPAMVPDKGIFSAAPIKDGDELVGYLYVFLEGVEDNLESLLNQSTAQTLSLLATAAAFATIFILGAGLLTGTTRKLSHLEQQIAAFEDSGFTDPNVIGRRGKDADELDRVQNITRSMAEKISQQIDALERSRRFGFDLITNLGHDVRTPVTNIQGYLEHILKKPELTPEQREAFLNTVLSNVLRLNNLLDELSSLIKFEKSLPLSVRKSIDLNKLVSDCTRETGGAIELSVLSEPASIRGDLHAVTQSIKSLLTNGLNNLQSGSLLVRTERAGADYILELIDGKRILGEESIEHYFDRFFREKGTPGSNDSGIEIALAKRILSAHGAKVRVASSREHGTGLRVVFPGIYQNS